MDRFSGDKVCCDINIKLFRSSNIQNGGDNTEYHVRKPKCDHRRQRSRIDEHLAEPHEEDVGETETDTYSYVQADASPSFSGGKAHTHKGQDESREW